MARDVVWPWEGLPARKTRAAGRLHTQQSLGSSAGTLKLFRGKPGLGTCPGQGRQAAPGLGKLRTGSLG